MKSVCAAIERIAGWSPEASMYEPPPLGVLMLAPIPASACPMDGPTRSARRRGLVDERCLPGGGGGNGGRASLLSDREFRPGLEVREAFAVGSEVFAKGFVDVERASGCSHPGDG